MQGIIIYKLIRASSKCSIKRVLNFVGNYKIKLARGKFINEWIRKLLIF